MTTKRNFQRAARKIEALRRSLGEKNVIGLRVIAEEIMTDVKASRPGKGVPVLTGTLRSTGRVEGSVGGKVELSFGGASAPYAMIQHEGLHFHHRLGEARYLTRGVDRWRANGVSVARARQQLQDAIDKVAQK